MSDASLCTRRSVSGALLCALTASCVKTPKTAEPDAGAPASAAAAKGTPAPVAPPILSFDEAVANTIRSVFASAPAPDASPAIVVVDPLVDGATGYQSSATETIQARIIALAKKEFPQYSILQITSERLGRLPRFLIGTFTPIDAELKSEGQRESYWFCLVMGDLKTGRIIAKSVARARLDDVNATPTAAFADSPVWTDDPSVQAYVATCKGSRVGDPIKPEYLDGLLAAALVSEASTAYDDGRYTEALDLFRTARRTSAGEQLRVFNGIYLSLLKLRRTAEATAAFGDLVAYGLQRNRLAVKFLFRPGSVRFAAGNGFSGNYDMWIQQIASRAASSRKCLQITGHTSPTGSALLNDRLSLLRAEYIQSRLEGDEPHLKQRTVADGKGSRENLIGTGRDDASDMLDRRVELSPIEACADTRRA